MNLVLIRGKAQAEPGKTGALENLASFKYSLKAESLQRKGILSALRLW